MSEVIKFGEKELMELAKGVLSKETKIKLKKLEKILEKKRCLNAKSLKK